MKFIRIIVGFVLITTQLVSCKKNVPSPPIDNTTLPQLSISTVLTGYEIIWGFDFLPNGDLLFNEKRGKVYRHSNGVVTELTGFPAVRNSGQGGLLES